MLFFDLIFYLFIHCYPYNTPVSPSIMPYVSTAPGPRKPNRYAWWDFHRQHERADPFRLSVSFCGITNSIHLISQSEQGIPVLALVPLLFLRDGLAGLISYLNQISIIYCSYTSIQYQSFISISLLSEVITKTGSIWQRCKHRNNQLTSHFSPGLVCKEPRNEPLPNSPKQSTTISAIQIPFFLPQTTPPWEAQPPPNPSPSQ